MAIVNTIASASALRVEVPAPQRINARAATGAETAQTPRRGPDTVDLSEQARYLDALRNSADVRTGLVQRVRGEIEAGTYESSDKFDAAVENLLDDLNT